MGAWSDLATLLVAIVVVAYAIAWQVRRNRATRERYARDWVERRAGELLVALPDYDDARIAQAVRDELQAQRVEDASAYRWAAPEVIARLRRMRELSARRA